MSKFSPEQLRIKSELAKAQWRDPEYRLKRIAAVKKQWSDPVFREKQRERSVARWKDVKLRKQMIESHKRRWDDPDYKKRKLEALNCHVNTIERRKKQGEIQRALWNNPEFRRGCIAGMRAARITPDIGRKISASQKRVWNNPEYRLKRVALARKQWSNPDFRSKATWNDPKYIEKWIAGCSIRPNKKELKLDELISSVVPGEYKLNVRAEVMTLGGKIPDFVNVNGKKKIIELYGDYWHGPKFRNNKSRQTPQERVDYFKGFGWDTLIVQEKELKNDGQLREKILQWNLT